MMWFDSRDERALYVDKRCGTYPVTRKSRPNAKATEVHPDMLVDFTEMPFPDASFNHVVFDPPHLSKIGNTSTTAKNYGKLMPGWEDVIAKGFSECFRVLKPGGTFIFKWCEFEIPLREILALTPEKPLYGHRTGARQKTHWVAFVKPSEVVEMRLCEVPMVMLRPNQDYRFTVDPNCEKCADAAKPYPSESQREAAESADEKPDGQAENAGSDAPGETETKLK